MSGPERFFLRGVAALILVALIASGCGADDFDATATSQEADFGGIQELGSLDDPDLRFVIDEIADGFGTMGAAEQAAISSVVGSGSTCTDASTDRAAPAPSQVEVEVVSVIDDCLLFTYETADFASFVADLEEMRQRPGVLAASPLLLDYRLDQVESNWVVDVIDGASLLDVPGGPTGQGVTVAVIDSGIDEDHPALATATIRRAPDSGSGDYVDGGHGTVAASILVGPIGGAARGLAPGIEILDVPADLCDPDICGCDPCAPMTAAEAIRWSTDNGADIISMSFGFLPTPKPAWWQILQDAGEIRSVVNSVEVALAYARANGVAMTAAAGNCADGPNGRCQAENQFELPAGHRDVIGVAALGEGDSGISERAWYSTQQSYVEIAAPGNLIIAGPEEILEKSGTSYATPFVAAAIAVLIGDDGPLANHRDASDVAREIIADTAVDIEPEGRDDASGHGRLQVGPALVAASAVPVEPEGEEGNS